MDSSWNTRISFTGCVVAATTMTIYNLCGTFSISLQIRSSFVGPIPHVCCPDMLKSKTMEENTWILSNLNEIVGPSMNTSEFLIFEKECSWNNLPDRAGQRLNEQVESHLQAPQPAVLVSLEMLCPGLGPGVRAFGTEQWREREGNISQGLVSISRYVSHHPIIYWGYFISNRYGCFGDVKQIPKKGQQSQPLVKPLKPFKANLKIQEFARTNKLGMFCDQHQAMWGE